MTAIEGEQTGREGTGLDAVLIAGLRAGDEGAFVTLVDRWHASMVRLARTFVQDQAVAEEVAQEAWLGVLKGLHSFEGRSSLKTWVFRIVANIARTRGAREARTVPFSALAESEADAGEAAVDPERFLPFSREPGPGVWASAPNDWEGSPEASALSGEMREYLDRAIAALPPAQREVIRLRDVEGWTATEVCNVLELTETNQRVLLHRARSKVRRALEQYFVEGAQSP